MRMRTPASASSPCAVLIQTNHPAETYLCEDGFQAVIQFPEIPCDIVHCRPVWPAFDIASALPELRQRYDGKNITAF